MHFFLNIPRDESLSSGSQISSKIQTDNSKLQTVWDVYVLLSKLKNSGWGKKSYRLFF